MDKVHLRFLSEKDTTEFKDHIAISKNNIDIQTLTVTVDNDPALVEIALEVFNARIDK